MFHARVSEKRKNVTQILLRAPSVSLVARLPLSIDYRLKLERFWNKRTSKIATVLTNFPIMPPPQAMPSVDHDLLLLAAREEKLIQYELRDRLYFINAIA